MKFKKFLALLLAVLLALSLVACGSVDDDDDDDNDEKASASDSERNEDKDDEKDDAKITKTGTEIYNEQGITVTYEDFEEASMFGAAVTLEIENQNEESRYVSSDYCSVNGFVVYAMAGAEIKGGETKEISMSLSSSDLEVCEIETVKTVEFVLEISDGDFRTLTKSELISLTVSNKKVSSKDFSKEGELLLDKNGIKVYAIKEINEDGVLGPEAYLYVVNDSNEYITVTDDDGVKVNGQETSAFFISDLYPGTKAMVDITFYEEDMEEKNITDIETLETTIKAYASDSYETIFDAEEITVEYK